MSTVLTGAAAAGFGLLLAVNLGFQSAAPQSAAPQRTPARAPDATGVELPRATVEVGNLPSSKRTVRVPAKANLQAALDAARPGDLLVLDAGATYEGPFLLPRKDGEDWIVIASSTSGQALPQPGQRVNKSHASLMPKLVASTGPVVRTEPGAHHYRLVGIEIAPTAGTFMRDLVQLGLEEREADALPHHVIIDRCYLHGDPKAGTRRGVALNSRHTAIVDSYLSEFKEVGADSQAIAGWNGSGPFRIANNYLEGAGENIMFGGADARIAEMVPSDIEIINNHLAKPLAWKIDHAQYAGTAWTVKNLFELKNARRVLVDGNLLEYNWPHGQNGFAILFTPRNQDGASPWSVVEDVTFVNNLIRHVGSGINMLGSDDNHPSGPARRIIVRNNLFEDVGGAWGNGRLFQLLDGVEGVTIDHNTARQAESIVFGGDRHPHKNFVFQNNVIAGATTGIIGSSTAPGHASLDKYFPGAIVKRNVLVGGNAEQYPADNFFPSSLQDNRESRAGTDGREIGADVEAITKAANR